MGERAPPGVLTGEPDVAPVEQQRSDGQRLAGRPVDLAVGEQLRPRLELLGELGVRRERLGVGRQRGEDPVEGRCARRRSAIGGSTPSGLGGRATLCGAGACARVSSRAACSFAWKSAERPLGLVDGDVTALDQRLDVQLAHAAVLGDRPVHQRLGVARVVALVVTVAPVAPHVDHDVLVELLAVLERQPRHAHARLGVVAVDVEDRRLHRLGHVAAVQRRAGELRGRREADLVVDDQVDGAADAVAR